MDEKDDKKKESIDDILSDLNGLLNRMPSILEGIKMPPLKPVEFENPVQEPEAEPQVLEPIAPAAEQKIESISPETNPEPEKQVPQSPAQSDILYSPAEKKGHEKQKPALKSRSDNLDSEKKHTGLPAPVTLDAQAEQKIAKDEISGSAPLAAAPLFGYAGARDIKGELSALPGTSGDAEAGNQAVLHTETGFAELSSEALLPPAENEKALPVPQSGDSLPTQGAGREAGPDHTKPRSYESTADFGIPDIDALFKISQGEMPPETLAPSAAEPVVPDVPHTALAGNLSADAVVADAGSASLNPASSGAENLEQELEKLTISDEIQSSAADSPHKADSVTGPQNGQTAAGGGETVADTEVAPMTSNENNSAGNGKEKQDLQNAESGLTLEQPGSVFSKGNSPEGGKTPAAAPASENAEQTPSGVGEPAAAPVSETLACPPHIPNVWGPSATETAGPSSFAPALLPGASEGRGPVKLSSSEADPPSGGLVLEQPGSVFSKGNSPEGDKTLVMAPSADVAGDEHTVICQSGPDTTARRLKGSDLAALSQKQPPEGVTEERVKSLAFLYPEGEEWFCAEVLSELDAICLKSPSKPMFVRRAFVKVFELNTNPNFMFQSVSDAKAAGLIFAGTLPQDKVYELESVFSSSGGLFRHLTADSFSHSSALDLVSELILR